MEDLFSNTSLKEKKLTKKIINEKGKNNIIMNNNYKSIQDNMTENDDKLLTNNKCTKDPLNLFSDELNDSVDMLIHNSSNKYENFENKKNSIIDDDFTINEDLLGINSSASSITHNKNNLDNCINKNKDPLNLFSNDIGSTSNEPFKNSLNIEKISNKNIKNKLKNKIPMDNENSIKEELNNEQINNEYCAHNKNEDNENINKDNDNELLSSENTNDELKDLYNLFSNDIKNSSNIDSDEEFIMSPNQDCNNNDKICVKDLYSTSNIKNNEDSIDLIINDNEDSPNNDIFNIFEDYDKENKKILSNEPKNNFDSKNSKSSKAKAEMALVRLFDNEVNEPASSNNINLENYEDNNDVFPFGNKKYFKQASINEVINKKKSRDEEELKKLFNEDKKKDNSSTCSCINIDNEIEDIKFDYIDNDTKRREIKSLSHSRRRHKPKKNKLDFYFKELPSSSASSSSSPASSSRMSENENNKIKLTYSPLYYNIEKNKKRINEDDIENISSLKNPFLISKKQKIEKTGIGLSHQDEQSSLNNVLLKFESNDKPKKSLVDTLSKSKQKQKRQVSLLTLFSQSEKKSKDKTDEKTNDYNSIIDSLSNPKKIPSQFNGLHKSSFINQHKSSLNINNRIRIKSRQSKLSVIDNINYIEPSVYMLKYTEKENNDNGKTYHKLRKRNLQPNIQFECQKVLNTFQPRHNKINHVIINKDSTMNSNSQSVINDSYDLMKSNLIKRKSHHFLINSFEGTNNQNNNVKTDTEWPGVGWKNYFQNSIENTF